MYFKRHNTEKNLITVWYIRVNPYTPKDDIDFYHQTTFLSLINTPDV